MRRLPYVALLACSLLLAAANRDGGPSISAAGGVPSTRPTDQPGDRGQPRPAPPGPASLPNHEVVIARNVMVPMRDGVKLATDVYFPARDAERLPGKWPVIFERTPYDKAEPRLARQGEWFARRGYVAVVQDIRGRYASEGTFYIYRQEFDDGLDAVTWINRQPWSNAKIGLTGGSYSAATVHSILLQNPPGIGAAFIRQGSSNYHEDGAWQGGAFELSHNLGYALSLGMTGKEATADQRVRRVLAQANDGLADRLLLPPLRPGASFLALAPSYDTWYGDWQQHDRYDDYWRHPGYAVETSYGTVADVPILFLGAWYDRFHRGTMNNFLGYSQRNRSAVHLHTIPVVHGPEGPEVTYSGDVDFGPSAAVIEAPAGTRMMELNLHWFDRWLKGLQNGVADRDLVRLFRMEPGEGRRNADGRLQAAGTWHEFPSWPPPDATFTDFFLTPDLELRLEPPQAAELTFAFDPQRPVPTIGGSLTSGGRAAPGGAYDQRCRTDLPLCPDALSLSARADVLSFTTPPLTADVDVTGPVTVHLWVASTAADTDFTGKLIDVYPPTADYPDGYAMNLVDSIVRARLRGFEQIGPHYHRAYGIRDEPLEPGRTYEITIDLASTSNLFRAGHRIRLDISSSNFPRFDTNPNTGEPYAARRRSPVLARNTIHMGAERASKIVLPIRPATVPPRSGRP